MTTVDASTTVEGEQLVYEFTSFTALVLCVVEFERHFHKLNPAFNHHTLPFFSYSCWVIQAKFLGTNFTQMVIHGLFFMCCLEFLRPDKQKEHRRRSNDLPQVPDTLSWHHLNEVTVTKIQGNFLKL